MSQIKSKRAEKLIDETHANLYSLDTIFKHEAKEAVIIAEHEANERSMKSSYEFLDIVLDAFCKTFASNSTMCDIGDDCRNTCVAYNDFLCTINKKLNEK